MTLEYEENPPQDTTHTAMDPVGETCLEIFEPNKAGTDISVVDR
ncbi:MAG: hypothetical protein P8J24_04155 [Arenicellales bacterium]|nr:hypothetical protein [Arenicellales bacterium]